MCGKNRASHDITSFMWVHILTLNRWATRVLRLQKHTIVILLTILHYLEAKFGFVFFIIFLFNDHNLPLPAPTASPCKDIWNVKKCRNKKKNGKCKKKRVKSNCQKTCRYCENDSSGTTLASICYLSWVFIIFWINIPFSLNKARF